MFFLASGGAVSDFEAIKGYLQRVDRWHETFEPLVRELLELREARDVAFARAREAPTVAGSKGQERENPAWQTFLRLQAAVDRLSVMLLLTPRAADRAGVRLPADNPFDQFGELDGGWSEIYGDDPFAALANRRGNRTAASDG